MEGQPAYPVRASDDEREQVLRALRDRVTEGRMSHDTFERRVGQVLRARSQAELADIVHDLPPTSRFVDRITGFIGSLSEMMTRIESAWRAPRLPRFTLPAGEPSRIILGRAPSCNFVLADLSVSRVHAELYRDEGGEWMVRDLGSMNGTRVNGWRLTGPTRVRPGDQLGMGNLTFLIAPS